MRFLVCFFVVLTLLSLALPQRLPVKYDCIIRNGNICDGTGSPIFQGDVAISGDTIAAMGNLSAFRGSKQLDASGMVVAPGFINMLSWSDESLVRDGRCVSDIVQGVTLEVLGEGFSPGPVRRSHKAQKDTLWTTLGGYFRKRWGKKLP